MKRFLSGLAEVAEDLAEGTGKVVGGLVSLSLTAPVSVVGHITGNDELISASVDISTAISNTGGNIGRIPAQLAGDRLRTVGGMIDQVVQGRPDKALEELRKDLEQMKDIALSGGGTIAARVYTNYLEQQASFRKLPSELVNILKKHYSKINFNEVRYATGIDLVRDVTAVTVMNNIYFQSSSVDFTDLEDMRTLVHELKHVQQFIEHGGYDGFMLVYMAQHVMAGGSHPDIPLEKEAIEKARRIVEEVCDEYRTSCNRASSSSSSSSSIFSSAVNESQKGRIICLTSCDSDDIFIKGLRGSWPPAAGGPNWAKNEAGVRLELIKKIDPNTPITHALIVHNLQKHASKHQQTSLFPSRRR